MLPKQGVFFHSSIREKASQWHEVYCHDLKVMSSNPSRAEIGGV